MNLSFKMYSDTRKNYNPYMPYDLSKKGSTSLPRRRMSSQDHETFTSTSAASNSGYKAPTREPTSSSPFARPSVAASISKSAVPKTASSINPLHHSTSVASSSGYKAPNGEATSSSPFARPSVAAITSKSAVPEPASPIIPVLEIGRVSDTNRGLNVSENCIVANSPGDILQIPLNAKIMIDRSQCVILNLPNAMNADSFQQLLKNSIVTYAKPRSIILNNEVYPNEFHPMGDQIFKLDLVAASPNSYVSVFSNRPDPQKFPNNTVRIIHSVMQTDEKIIEKQSKYFHKNGALACATIFKVEREEKTPGSITCQPSTN